MTLHEGLIEISHWFATRMKAEGHTRESIAVAEASLYDEISRLLEEYSRDMEDGKFEPGGIYNP